MANYGRVVVEAGKGVHVADAAAYAVEVAKRLGEAVELEFNGKRYEVGPTSTAMQVFTRFQLMQTPPTVLTRH